MYNNIMNTLIITNNEKVNIEFINDGNVEYHEDAEQTEILLIARNYIHLGARLIMHPMLGRIKPHETPYKSIFLENVKGEVDFESLIIIEDSIAETKKFLCDTMRKKYDDTMLEDLRYIDYLLLKNGIDEYRR